MSQIFIPSTTPSFRGALVELGSNQAFTVSGQLNNILWDTQVYDTDDIWEGVTNKDRFTIPAGVSQVKFFANLSWASNSTGYRSLILDKNGVADFAGMFYIQENADATGIHNMNACSAVLDVAEAEYFFIRGAQSSGGSLNLNGNARTSAAMQIIA